MSIHVSHCVTNTVMEGPGSRWPTRTVMQSYSVCFMDNATMSTLAHALEHEFPGETKMMKRTSKPCPERPQAPALLCFYIHTFSIDTTVTRPMGSLDESTAGSHAVMLEAHQLLSILTAICRGKCFSTKTSSSVSFFPKTKPL